MYMTVHKLKTNTCRFLCVCAKISKILRIPLPNVFLILYFKSLLSDHLKVHYVFGKKRSIGAKIRNPRGFLLLHRPLLCKVDCTNRCATSEDSTGGTPEGEIHSN